MKKIAVFCSASDVIDPIFLQCAEEVGQWIGECRYSLVYGGASLGMMERVAAGTKAAGGTVVGVVPTKLEQNGKVSKLLDVVLMTNNLSDRKDKMIEMSDMLIALPGGVGTLDEIFHAVAAVSIGYHSKKIVLFNLDGFYDTLLDLLNELKQKGFMRHPISQYITVVNSTNELKQLTIE